MGTSREFSAMLSGVLGTQQASDKWEPVFLPGALAGGL